jgi:hypothetical protein
MDGVEWLEDLTEENDRRNGRSRRKKEMVLKWTRYMWWKIRWCGGKEQRRKIRFP